MTTREMLRLSWRAWLSRSGPGVGPWWLGLVWTVLFCVAVALVFTALSMLVASPGAGHVAEAWWAAFRVSIVMSLTIGFAVRMALAIGDAVIGRARLWNARPWQRSLYYALVPMLGAAMGWPLGLWWATGIDARRFFSFDRPQFGALSLIVFLFICLVFQQFFATKSRQIQAENRATEAQLRLLQAQIEPHFLFNTLANVVSLMESDTTRAKLMLESFVDYLRASLSGLGGDRHTLGDEIDLVEAYLRVVKIRMDDRLDYTIDVAPALRSLRLPALTLQPLVENAIVHGLEPRIAGGRVRVGACLDRRSLLVTVDDDGGGLAESMLAAPPRQGTRTALVNIRKRLQQLYGDAASLRIEAAVPHGVHVSLTLPVPNP